MIQRSNNKVYGVLNDFEHLYRHDLEPFFYALLWIAVRFEAGEEREDGMLQIWADSSAEQLFEKKTIYMTTGLIPDLTGPYAAFGDWLLGMLVAISRGRAAQHDYRLRIKQGASSDKIDSFDLETLGGHITFDGFEKILGIPVE